MKTNGLDEFKNKLPQAWDNFRKDSTLNRKAKDEFVKHLRKFKGSDIIDHAKNFFFNPMNQLMGPKVVLRKGEVLGRVVNKSLFNYYIDSIHRASSKGTAPSLKGSSAISTHILPPSDKKLKFLKRHLGTASLSSYNMFSFRNEVNPANPFDNGINSKDIPCVLGLSHTVPPYFRLEYKLAHEAHLPTAFDAATNEAWRPGGKTFPLDACRKRYTEGLPEVVHKPSSFNDIERPLEEI